MHLFLYETIYTNIVFFNLVDIIFQVLKYDTAGIQICNDTSNVSIVRLGEGPYVVHNKQLSNREFCPDI